MADNTVISNASGDSTLPGTAEAYTFVFDPNNGNDVVTDLTNGEDVTNLSTFPTISNFSDMTITSGDDGVTIDLTGHRRGANFPARAETTNRGGQG